MCMERSLLVALLLSVACQAPDRLKPLDDSLAPTEASLASSRLVALAPSDNGISITLDNAFIQAHARRVTIDTQFTVDKAHDKPNAPSKDGDLHIAGRAPEIRLPAVAEIMNAKYETAAMTRIHAAEGTGAPVAISGVWRIWCEHAGSSTQVQGAALTAFNTTNPDHVFEIHPVTRVADIQTLASLRPIAGFEAKDAARAFDKYESITCRIAPGATQSTIHTKGAGYNYVEFVLEPIGPLLNVDDGTFVMANVRATDGDLLVRSRRMVFVKDSEPEISLRALKPGQGLHVLGLPRLNCSLLQWRIDNALARPEALEWDFPYEIVVVGVYEVVEAIAATPCVGSQSHLPLAA